MSNLFSGIVATEVKCGDRHLTIDKQAYRAALKNTHDYLPDINLAIDDNKYSTHKKIIKFIYHADMPRAFVQKVYKQYDHNNFNKIPEFLAIISWCDMFLRPSESYNSFVSEVKKMILLAVRVVRAMVNNDFTTISFSDRIELLTRVGLNKILPLLSAAKDMIVMMEPNIKNYVVISAGRNYKDSCGGVDTIGDISEIEISDIPIEKVHMDTRFIEKYIWNLYHHTLILVAPEYLRVENFGPGCAKVVRKLFNYEEIQCGEDDITDIFRHGIGKLSCAILAK